jgi:hypothetical protein
MAGTSAVTLLTRGLNDVILSLKLPGRVLLPLKFRPTCHSHCVHMTCTAP